MLSILKISGLFWNSIYYYSYTMTYPPSIVLRFCKKNDYIFGCGGLAVLVESRGCSLAVMCGVLIAVASLVSLDSRHTGPRAQAP